MFNTIKKYENEELRLENGTFIKQKLQHMASENIKEAFCEER